MEGGATFSRFALQVRSEPASRPLHSRCSTRFESVHSFFSHTATLAVAPQLVYEWARFITPSGRFIHLINYKCTRDRNTLDVSKISSVGVHPHQARAVLSFTTSLWLTEWRNTAGMTSLVGYPIHTNTPTFLNDRYSWYTRKVIVQLEFGNRDVYRCT